LIKNSPTWEISAAYDAIFSARDVNLADSIIFLSYFPCVDDLKLIIAVGIKILYFFGEIADSKAVDLMNKLSDENIILEVIHLT